MKNKKNIAGLLGGGNARLRNVIKRAFSLGLAVVIGCSSMTSYAAVRDNVSIGFDSYEDVIIETNDITEDGNFALIGVPNNGLYNTNSQLKVPIETLLIATEYPDLIL